MDQKHLDYESFPNAINMKFTNEESKPSVSLRDAVVETWSHENITP